MDNTGAEGSVSIVGRLSSLVITETRAPVETD